MCITSDFKCMGKIKIHTIVYAILISIMILPKNKIKFNITLYKYNIIQNLNKGPFKCYVTLEGVGGCMPKRYEVLRGDGGGLRQRYVTSFFLAYTAWFTVMSARPTRISK